MNIKELNNNQAPQKCKCEKCGKNTICYLQGSITPITRQLAMAGQAEAEAWQYRS